jgi:hypothetical protein
VGSYAHPSVHACPRARPRGSHRPTPRMHQRNSLQATVSSVGAEDRSRTMVTNILKFLRRRAVGSPHRQPGYYLSPSCLPRSSTRSCVWSWTSSPRASATRPSSRRRCCSCGARYMSFERQINRVRWTPGERIVLAALNEWLPRTAWSSLRVQPELVWGCFYGLSTR